MFLAPDLCCLALACDSRKDIFWLTSVGLTFAVFTVKSTGCNAPFPVSTVRKIKQTKRLCHRCKKSRMAKNHPNHRHNRTF